MLVLYQTPSGFALFVLDEEKLANVEDLANEFSSADSAQKMVSLKAFKKFENTSEAVETVVNLEKGILSEDLCEFLKTNGEGETLALADPSLMDIIKEKLGIECINNDAVDEMVRGVGSHLTQLVPESELGDLASATRSLSHSLAEYQLSVMESD